jgi:hypothetical protein
MIREKVINKLKIPSHGSHVLIIVLCIDKSMCGPMAHISFCAQKFKAIGGTTFFFFVFLV